MKQTIIATLSLCLVILLPACCGSCGKKSYKKDVKREIVVENDIVRRCEDDTYDYQDISYDDDTFGIKE